MVGCSGCKPLVQGRQLGVEDGGLGQAQMAGPAGPGGMGHGHLGARPGRVHGPGALLAQHGRRHRPGGHIQGDGQFRAHRAAVLADGHHLQAGGVDLYLLAGRSATVGVNGRTGAVVAMRAGSSVPKP
ncbi:hypothetical protein [Streptomyces sp. NPDC002540]